ncbi:MAG TPA: GH1 family beta-glucosidase [Galbitalea sp.]|jgi:beta-glucosidase
MPFPKGFTWGAATSAYQVEGSTQADGRGVSIWDTFAAQPGTIADHSTGDPAADHYRLWEQDLDLMQDLGLKSYRFSVAWPRIVPLGTGTVNQKGLDFYRGLIEGLLKRGIKPAITLYHWDLPQPLQDVGGWANRATATAFANYADILFREFSDVGADWFTINEPKTTAFNGYAYGVHAPGLQNGSEAGAAVHHQLLAHGLAVRKFRASGAKGRIGIALNLMPVYAISAEAKQATTYTDGVENRLFLDPILLGRYPTDAVGGLPGQIGLGSTAFESNILPGDLAIIRSHCDYLAVQYYGVAGVDFTGYQVVIHPVSLATWQQIYPQGLYDLLTRIKRDYPAIPLIITENGMPDPTSKHTVDDPYRVTFLREHFQQASRAIAAGVPLEGYYVWSLLDNFEWAEGYTQRFGIVAVDFATQKRTPKKSAALLGSVIRANAVARA